MKRFAPGLIAHLPLPSNDTRDSLAKQQHQRAREKPRRGFEFQSSTCKVYLKTKAPAITKPPSNCARPILGGEDRQVNRPRPTIQLSWNKCGIIAKSPGGRPIESPISDSQDNHRGLRLITSANSKNRANASFSANSQRQDNHQPTASCQPRAFRTKGFNQPSPINFLTETHWTR